MKFWWAVDKIVEAEIRLQTQNKTHGIKFYHQKGMLVIELPSIMRLSYLKPNIERNQFGGKSVTYEDTGSTKKCERIESYDLKFVENIIQAISRDILIYAMSTLRHCFISGHFHDIHIIESSLGVSLEAVCKQRGITPP